jgi:hypothetical protein
MTGMPKGPQPPSPPTTRRAEVEKARRTTPVQALRTQLKSLAGDDEAIKRIAEALRRVLRRD